MKISKLTQFTQRKEVRLVFNIAVGTIFVAVLVMGGLALFRLFNEWLDALTWAF